MSKLSVSDYTHRDVRDLADRFRRIDARVGRDPGLRNMRALVSDYYYGADATVWYAAIDAERAKLSEAS